MSHGPQSIINILLPVATYVCRCLGFGLPAVPADGHTIQQSHQDLLTFCLCGSSPAAVLEWPRLCGPCHSSICLFSYGKGGYYWAQDTLCQKRAPQLEY